jgi:hypothetical protein
VSVSKRNNQQEANMIAIARGSITEPDRLGPFVDDEMRAAGPGVVIILVGESMDAIRERMNILPFVIEGLMTLDYEEVYEI